MPAAEPTADEKPDINEMAMASILEERASVYTVHTTFREMRKHYGLVESSHARNKARELLKILGA